MHSRDIFSLRTFSLRVISIKEPVVAEHNYYFARG